MKRRALIALVVLVIGVVVGISIQRRARRKIPLRIATGQRGGTFLPLGQALASSFVAFERRRLRVS